ncbi:hypothetical protein [Agrobacterium rosae]|uniref:hypothetical protein n=1 Tax=Agrobacterium rosae TaxID=1972867 RepID=UPI000CD8BC58|nr:hypothetical protein [Agrobacterium rosae]POO56703.1 hypothetical protein CTT39_08460 [Agrobacterium rosae]
MAKPAAKTQKKTPADKLLKLRKKSGTLAVLDEDTTLIIAVRLYLIAYHLCANVDDWQRFCEHADWVPISPKPQPKDESRKKALQFVIRFFVGFNKDANGNRVRKFYDILKGAWDDDVPPNEIDSYVKKVQAEKRERAAETRAKRKVAAIRSIKLLPSDASRLVIAKTGDLALKGEFKIRDAGGPMMSLEITGLSDKSCKKLGVVKPVTPKPAGK